MEYFAHSTADPLRRDWQILADHLNSVSRIAALRGQKFGAARLAALAGVLHDLGKYTAPFQRRITGQSSDRVPHADAGARLALAEVEACISAKDPFGALAWEIVAHVIAGHHAGLYDRFGEGSLQRIVDAAAPPVDPQWKDEIRLETQGLWPALSMRPEHERTPFQLAFLGRMVFSCLIDADRLDTEVFYVARGETVADRDWPGLAENIDLLIGRLDDHLAGLRARAGAVNAEREAILAHVLARAGDARGVFTLTVPTGGGKTLASLAFALRHARRHGLDRIILAIPFTSIIDQTAAIFRDVLGEDAHGRAFVLEHHSNLALDTAEAEDGFRDRSSKSKMQLAMEDWGAPIVITTNVQLFESLFSHRPSRCRKLHNIARSVVILDEAQTVPREVLKPSVAALDELARNYGASVVLCTATQPALRLVDGFIGGFEIDEGRELAPSPRDLALRMRRVTLAFAGVMDAAALVTAMAAHAQVLTIVNTRGHALGVYRAADAAGLEGLIHLTTRQCAHDRKSILSEIKARLKAGRPCRVVATSLVEAGVDFDFPRVWRAEAGLDQIHQAAGRCNREGRRPVDESIVTVFQPDGVKPPGDIGQLVGAMRAARSRHDDALSLEMLKDYFGEVYWLKGDGLDELRSLAGDAHGRTVRESFTVAGRKVSLDYRTVGERFRLIDSGMAPVIIPCTDEAKKALAELQRPNAAVGAIARLLQPYIVQIPPKARLLLMKNGKAQPVAPQYYGDQFIKIVKDSIYSSEIGLLWEKADYVSIDDLMY